MTKHNYGDYGLIILVLWFVSLLVIVMGCATQSNIDSYKEIDRIAEEFSSTHIIREGIMDSPSFEVVITKEELYDMVGNHSIVYKTRQSIILLTETNTIAYRYWADNTFYYLAPIVVMLSFAVMISLQAFLKILKYREEST